MILLAFLGQACLALDKQIENSINLYSFPPKYHENGSIFDEHKHDNSNQIPNQDPSGGAEFDLLKIIDEQHDSHHDQSNANPNDSIDIDNYPNNYDHQTEQQTLINEDDEPQTFKDDDDDEHQTLVNDDDYQTLLNDDNYQQTLLNNYDDHQILDINDDDQILDTKYDHQISGNEDYIRQVSMNDNDYYKQGYRHNDDIYIDNSRPNKMSSITRYHNKELGYDSLYNDDTLNYFRFGNENLRQNKDKKTKTKKKKTAKAASKAITKAKTKANGKPTLLKITTKATATKTTTKSTVTKTTTKSTITKTTTKATTTKPKVKAKKTKKVKEPKKPKGTASWRNYTYQRQPKYSYSESYFGVLQDFEVRATKSQESKYPWIARVVHSRSKPFPHIATAACIETRIFITAARSIYSLKAQFTSVLYSNKQMPVISIILPSKPSKQHFDDIGILVVKSGMNLKWNMIKVFSAPRKDDYFNWFEDLHLENGPMHKAIGYASDRASSKVVTVHTKYQLVELDVVLGIEMCVTIYSVWGKIEKSFHVPCFHPCTPQEFFHIVNNSIFVNKCQKYLGVEGAVVINTKTNTLMGIATWGETALSALQAINFALPVGVAIPNSKNFLEDYACATKIRNDKTDPVPSGYYQKLCS